jgi:hypothetical protein
LSATAWDLRNGPARALWHIGCPICGKQFEMRRRTGRKPTTCASTWCVGILRYQRRYGRWPSEPWVAWFAVENGLLRLPKRLTKRIA